MTVRGIVVFLLVLCSASTLEAKGRQYFVLDSQANLRLFPQKNAESLEVLPFGTFLNGKNQKKESNGYFYAETEAGLAGWISSESVRRLKDPRLFADLVDRIDRMLYLDSPRIQDLRPVLEFLDRLEEKKLFYGQEYLHLKLKRGVILGKLLDRLNEVSPRYSSYRKELEASHRTRLIFVATEKRYRMNPEYFWKVAQTFTNTKEGDFAGFLAVEYFLDLQPNCNRKPSCVLPRERLGRIRYLSLLPNGNYAERYRKEIKDELDNVSKPKDAIDCMPKDRSILQKELDNWWKQLQFLPSRYGKTFRPFLETIQNKCTKI